MRKRFLDRLGLPDLARLLRLVGRRGFAYTVGLLGDSATEASIVILVPIIIKFMVEAAIEGRMELVRRGSCWPRLRRAWSASTYGSY